MGLTRRLPGDGGAVRLPAGRVAAGSVVVRFFSAAEQATGHSSIRVEIAADETLGDLLDRLAEAYPAIAPLRASLLVAVNYEYVPLTRALAGGEEVALIPPVAGG